MQAQTLKTPKLESRLHRIIWQSVLALMIVILYTPPVKLAGIDLPVHLQWAQELALSGKINRPHYFFQQLVIFIHTLIPFHLIEKIHPAWAKLSTTWNIAGVSAVILFTIFLGEFIFLRIAKTIGSWKPILKYPVCLLLTLSLLFVAPITFFTWNQQRLYFGYMGITVFHNPTVLVLKPLALILFWTICDRFFLRTGLKQIGGIAVLSILALHTKPSYTICLLPALGLVVAYFLWKKRPFDLHMLVFGSIVPSVLFLLYQYGFEYGSPENNQIAFRPLAVMGNFLSLKTPMPLIMLFPFFILSVTFPLLATVFYYKPGDENFSLILAWLTFIISAGTVYLLAETGPQEYYGNLLWGGQVTLFILFIETTLLMLRSLIKDWEQKRIRKRSYVAVLVLALHVTCGIFFAVQTVLNPASQAWW